MKLDTGISVVVWLGCRTSAGPFQSSQDRFDFAHVDLLNSILPIFWVDQPDSQYATEQMNELTTRAANQSG